MATIKQIVTASREYEEAQSQLQRLRDRKQELQDQLAALTVQIQDLQPRATAFFAALKTLVNE